MNEPTKKSKTKIVTDRELLWGMLEPGEQFYVQGRVIAEMLDVSHRRIGQLVLDEGLPRVERDLFFVPAVNNWVKVETIAKAMRKRPTEIGFFGFVNCDLAVDRTVTLYGEYLAALRRLLSDERG